MIVDATKKKKKKKAAHSFHFKSLLMVRRFRGFRFNACVSFQFKIPQVGEEREKIYLFSLSPLRGLFPVSFFVLLNNIF